MWYVIHGIDSNESLERRMAVRPEHLARLRVLHEQGRLLLAGPLPACDQEDPGSQGFVGSLVVAEFSDLAAARAWIADDPYVAAGVFSQVNVYPFKRVLP